MSVQTEEHLKRIGATLGERDRVLPMMLDYCDRAGISRADFARRIDYSPATLRQFESNKYHHVAGTCVHICRAIERYITENPLEPPKEVIGDLYDTENVDVIRETVRLLLPRPMAYMIYGPPGSEKSFALEYTVAELNRIEASRNGHGRRAYYLYADTEMTMHQLWREIAVACGTPSRKDKSIIARNLAHEFRDRRVLLVIDEAQHLDNDCLDSLRRLLDRPPYFSLLFAGSHDLKLRLDRYSAQLGQLNSRIIRKVMLPGVSRQSAERIVSQEIGEHLGRMENRKRAALVDNFIAGAMDRDTYTLVANQPTPYINIRTLSNSLAHYKQKKLQQKKCGARDAD